MPQLLRFLPFACLIFLLATCTEEPSPVLTYKDKDLVDSLFRKQVDSLRLLHDARCAARFDSALHFKVDSLLKARTEEIQRYLEKIKQEGQQ